MTTVSPADDDAEKRQALKRMRRIAGAVLGGMTLVFLATHIPSEPSWGILLLRAMAEAGMIGGVADWFAVEALFRRPLGLPIPHTALLPSNQQKAARNVGRFFDAYFLDPQEIAARVKALEPARRAASWLTDRGHAKLVARHLTEALGFVLTREPPPKIAAKIRKEMRGVVGAEAATTALARAIAPALKDGLRGPVVTDILGSVRGAVDENRDRVVDLVQARSRWWIASGLDRRVSDLLVNGVLELLDDLGAEDSEARGGFEEALGEMIDALGEDGALTKAVARGKESFLASNAFEDLLAEMTRLAQERMRSEVEEDPERVAGLLADALQRFAGQLLADPQALSAFEARLAEGARGALADLREPISKYVSDVIANWDPDTLSERFETEIGPDLQFIRVNGAVLGAMIGGALFGVGALLGAH